MLQGSYVEQITELFQTDDLSASELFPVMFQINIGGKKGKYILLGKNVFLCVGTEMVCNESIVFLFPSYISCYPKN